MSFSWWWPSGFAVGAVVYSTGPVVRPPGAVAVSDGWASVRNIGQRRRDRQQLRTGLEVQRRDQFAQLRRHKIGVVNLWDHWRDHQTANVAKTTV
ncbi:MAG: hypothetical protein ACF8AM_05995 [Rhodopirellula sp. JB055]|uniref:hypothetical protein n=1 Tax=Rhodopirellula sp. JB055 TaxID=3342846 RepID=UPI00370C2A05